MMKTAGHDFHLSCITKWLGVYNSSFLYSKTMNFAFKVMDFVLKTQG